MDQPPEKRDVGSGAYRDIKVRDGRRPVEAGVDCDKLGFAYALRLDREAKSDRMVFCGVAAHYEDDIGIGHIRPAVGHRAATESGSQTGHRGAMSKAGLVFVGHHTESEAEFAKQVVDLVGIGTAADDRHVRKTIDQAVLGVLDLEARIARLLNEARHTVEGLIPRNRLPIGRTWSPIQWPRETPVVDHKLPERDPLGTEGTSINGAVRVPFDMDHGRCYIARLITECVNNDA